MVMKTFKINFIVIECFVVTFIMFIFLYVFNY